jgi:hypothetical protein
MAGSWWDRALGNNPAPAQRPSTNPQRYAPSKAARWQDNHPPTYVATEPQAIQQYQEGTIDVSGRTVLGDRGNPGDGGRSYQPNPKKIQSLRDDIGRCPECDGANYFSRAQGINMRLPEGRTASPAPRCMDCGYNGGAVYWQEASGAEMGQKTQQARQVQNPNSPAFSSGHVDFQHPIAHLQNLNR